MTNLIFEITTYDIPNDLQIKAEEDIKKLFFISLNSLGIRFDHILSFSTSRRITIYIINIDTIIKSKTIIKKGPSTNCNKEVLEKFLLNNNITIEECYQENTIKGKFYYAKIVTQDIPFKDILPNFIIKEILSKVTFKRSMFWNESKIKWARPITNLILCIGSDFIDFEFAGIKSSNKIKGHMFLSHTDIEITKAEDYFKEITKLKVVLLTYTNNLKDASNYLDKNPEISFLKSSREEIILKEINSFAINLNIIPNISNELLKELLYLVEYPVVLFGKIPNKYLVLPKELLINTLVKNQRYITFFNTDNSISENFALVSNLITPDKGATIVKGNQKVLNARLEDGLFFYEMDTKENWSIKKYELKKISFFENLGNMLDKQERLKRLAHLIFPNDDLSNICDFCKVDLASKVVEEFPDLQGTMGYYYAKLNGFNEQDALAIKEQYMPLSSTSELPQTILGAKLAFLDKLDTLISFFSIGKIPTSSGDPFALRRAALGIIRICIKYNLSINLNNYLKKNLLDFFIERLIVYLVKLGINKSVVLSVIDKDNFNIYEINYKSTILNNFLSSSDSILNIYKRIHNILQNNSINYTKTKIITIKKDILTTKEEGKLLNSIINIYCKYSHLIHLSSYDTMLNNIEFNNNQLIPNIKTEQRYLEFFNDVLVLIPIIDTYLNNELIINHDLPELTNNRVNLLILFIYLCKYIGNLDLFI